MELELNLTHLNCYDTVLDDNLSQEETMEAIVPDACPDIARIVDTEGTILLTGKEIKEGRAEISGVIKATVIYLPDGIEGVRRLEVTIPFRTSLEKGAIRPPGKLVAAPRLRSTDARILNPRKILIRADLSIAAKVFVPRTSTVCNGAQEGTEQGIQQQQTEENTYLVTAVQEKPFVFTDEVNISGSRPGAEELLKSRAEILCNESKIIGNKLIFKGEVSLQVLYRAADASLNASAFNLPFSQIMEVAGVEEDADNTLDVLMTDLSCNLNGDEEGRTISVNLGMLGQAVVREPRRVELLTDIYSTLYEHKADMQPYDFPQLEAAGNNRQNLRQQVETELPVKAVNDVNVSVGQLGQIREGGKVTLAAEIIVRVVYTAEDNSIRAAAKRFSAEHDVNLPPNSSCSFDVKPAGERQATPNADGLEVRLPLDFRYLALTSNRVSGVSKVTLNENARRDNSNQPSVVMRMVEPQEKLWDIAKGYATTTDDIMQANGITEEEAPAGRLLLIPKKR